MANYNNQYTNSMKTTTFFKSIKRAVTISLFTIVSLLGATVHGQFYQYDAVRSGHWNDPSVWKSLKAPGTTCTGVNIRISEGVTVQMDSSLNLCGDTLRGNSLMVNGRMVGDSSCLTLRHINLYGSGSVLTDSVIVCDRSRLALMGSLTCDRLINRCDTLFIQTGNVNINCALELENGILTSTRFGKIHFSDTCSVVNAGGQWINDGCTWSDSTRLHLNITSCRDSLKTVVGARWGDVTIDLSGYRDSIRLANDFVCTGTLNLRKGVLNLNKHQLTLNGYCLGDSGAIQCDSLSKIVINGAAPAMKIRFAAGRQYLGKLIAKDRCKVVLEGDVVITDSLELQSGILDISSASVNIQGTINLPNTHLEVGRNTTFTYHGTTKRDTIRFAAGKDYLGSIRVEQSNFPLVVASNLRVADSLCLNESKLQIRDGVLSMDKTCEVKGINAKSYIVTGTNGSLQRCVAGNNEELEFPIGTTEQYAPACISQVQGALTNEFRVNIANDVLSNGLVGVSMLQSRPMVKNTWHVECTSDTFKLNLKLNWTKEMETPGFNRSQCFISHYENSRWDSIKTCAIDSSKASLYMVCRDGIETLSPFTIMNASMPTRLPQAKGQTSVVVYPNPASDFINVTSETSGTSKLIVSDVMGRNQREYILNGENVQLNISNLSAGMYLYRLINDGKVAATGKLSVKK